MHCEICGMNEKVFAVINEGYGVLSVCDGCYEKIAKPVYWINN